MEDIKRQQTSNKEALSREVKVKPERPLTRVDSSATNLKSEKPMFNSHLMEAVCNRNNLQLALKRVKRNKGAPGIDGMTVDELGEYLRGNWPAIKAQLLNGSCKPKPVRRVTIPKPTGKGSRLLGIPCVLDRFIQQALLQVIQPVWDPKFSEHSYGFRPGRSAHQAIAQAQSYLEMGYEYVVDIDLEKFFDRVNHDRLMGKLHKEIEDKRVLKLLRSYLNAGVLIDGLVSLSTEGVSQGSPLSPFLSNVVLDELDKELEARGHKHARYGDDCNIYVKSKRAGERVKESITRFIEKRLKLKVNEDKSAVDLPRRRKFLGFTFTGGKKPNRRQIAPESIARFKVRIRQLTRRNRGVSMEERIEGLSKYMKGWFGYFGYCETPAILKELDGWIRRRLRCVYWKQWKTFKKRRAELIKRGIKEIDAIWTAMSPRGPWRLSLTPQVRRALNNDYFDKIGLPRLAPV
jgi:RNA-directed DNA polymerase